jgi:hypothetical protein|tara:strand:+ start:424 stop:1062 length:639 start_codon:yes stop_codon:yes gene_type:complete
MADKVSKGPEGYQKGDDIMSGIGQGAMQGAQYGSVLGAPGAIVGGLIGGISGGISGGKVTDADRAAYFARKEAERIQANPTEVAGFSPETQAKNVAAMTQALDPNDYAAAAQNPEMARQMQASIQQAGQAAVGQQAQMVAKAQQAQRDQVLNLLNYAADTERAEAQQKAVEAQARAYNAQANQMNQQTAAQAFDFQDDMMSIFNFGGVPTTG